MQVKLGMILSVPKQDPQPGVLTIDPSVNIEYLCPFLVSLAVTASHFTMYLFQAVIYKRR
jgi:hypothetical protein